MDTQHIGQKRGYQDDDQPTFNKAPKYKKDSVISAQLVAQHYNQRPEVGVARRKESRIIRMRSFNNWVKSVLIQRHTRPRQCVLDMGCGKGGDLLKWAKAKIGYLIAADIAAVSLTQMQDRYNGLRNRSFGAEFHALDCYSESIEPHLETQRPVDVVSMQFCLHYAFESEEKARMMLHNVSRHLRSGGQFIGTIPDANLIVKRVRQEPPDVLGFGNEFYWIEFDPLPYPKSSGAAFTPFGCKYMFHLEDAVDCPEYLVHWGTFERLANEYGLELNYKENFHPFYQRAKTDKDHARLLQRIGVVGGQEPEMSVEEWEAAGIYLAFAFTKR
ncbi:guanine-N(7)-methyltransferase domain-containing protein [Halteromyces radiatus]|uniref:guanine-N(7)-methyltransferase domain-containing protein n=1 Tax=Halteromyces radiatus TaxID=101107 RepID=UPI00221E7FB3|nr:guanine-N(7)-methyltransferase domain-containing protein [Halteromyces radiatus]KAI8098503.1 guanine-N(7)-methyltransferase domain-containing protein [Halteromyces radiatus]